MGFKMAVEMSDANAPQKEETKLQWIIISWIAYQGKSAGT